MTENDIAREAIAEEINKLFNFKRKPEVSTAVQLELAELLVEAKRACAWDKIPFGTWVKKKLDMSVSSATAIALIGESPNPSAALQKHREKSVKRSKKHREEFKKGRVFIRNFHRLDPHKQREVLHKLNKYVLDPDFDRYDPQTDKYIDKLKSYS
jgi:hypothetical protein